MSICNYPLIRGDNYHIVEQIAQARVQQWDAQWKRQCEVQRKQNERHARAGSVADLDQKNRELIAFGKGSKERRLPLDPRTLQAILRYLDTRAEPERPDLPLFATENETALCRQNLRRLLERVGERAGVEGVHPHRFRHTFAIAFLRNSGDIYSLQRMMGHSTLTMVQRYLALAQSDVTQAHRRASPVANWHL